MRGQARFPFLPREAIRRAQRARLGTMVRHAYQTVPYYRETMDRLGMRPDDVRDVEDLATLPIIERDALQRDPEYFVSRAHPLGDYLELRTSGSTGAPRSIFHDTASIFQNAAHGERERSIFTSLISRSTAYREAWLGVPNEQALRVQPFIRERLYIPPAIRVRRCYFNVFDPPATLVNQLNEFRPHLIHGSGASFEILFPYLWSSGARLLRPRVLVFTAAELSHSVRRLIERQFEIPVFSTYTSTEALKIGFECERHLGLHLNEDLYSLSLVDGDGKPLPPGHSGEVIVSNLVNRATVLFNYRLGDISTLDERPCPCGRTLPLLTALQGRADDIIELPSGRRIHPVLLSTLVGEEQQIWQFQVVQRSERLFEIAVVADRDADQVRLRTRLLEKAATIFDDSIGVEIVFPDSIDRTRAGKLCAVLSLRQNRSVSDPAYPSRV